MQLQLALALALASAPVALAQGTFEALTDQPFGFGVFEPSITPDGALVAYRSTADPLGTNPEGNFEIFLVEAATGTQLQLTDTPFGVGNFLPQIGPEGNFVVFRSAFDYAGDNPDGLFELFEVDVASGATRQVTDNPGGVSVFDPELSGDGAWITYRMFGDPVGLNPDGNFEIFRVERATGLMEQITQTTSGNRENPTISRDGSRIAFAARENYDGTNPNGNLEIWVWDESTGLIEAATQNPTGTLSNDPSIGPNGRYVSFLSLYDFTGGGAIGNKIHVADTALGTVALATPIGTGNPPLPPKTSSDGAHVYFESDRSLAGLNLDANRELFRYTIATGALEQVTDTVGGLSKNQLSDDARASYVAIATDGTFAYRSEQPLGPGGLNPGGNLELILGRPNGCSAEPYGTAPIAAALGAPATALALDFIDLGPTLGDLFLQTPAGPAVAFVFVSLAPTQPLGGLPLWIDPTSIPATLTLPLAAAGGGLQQLSLQSAGGNAGSIYLQAATLDPVTLEPLLSNGLRLDLCP